MAKIGLIIQGPLFSSGMSGSNLSKEKNDKLFVDYECRDNIRRIISEYGHLFEKIVISTWNQEVIDGENFSGAELIVADDPGGLVLRVSSDKLLENNRHRQFQGILAGLEYLLKHTDVDYVIRIRTDQFINLAILVADFKQQLLKEEISSDAIFVPHLNKRRRYHIPDFYLGGTSQSLKTFCQAMLAYDRAEFAVSVHNEIILKYAYVNYRDKLEVSDHSYFSKSSILASSKGGNKIYDYMLTNIFFAFDIKILDDLEWRGEKVSKEWYQKNLKLQSYKYSNFNLPDLIAIDWLRYYDFAYKILNRSPKKSIIPQYFLDAAWKIWLYIEKVFLAYYKIRNYLIDRLKSVN